MSVSHIQVKYTTASTTFYLSDGKKEEHDQGKEKKRQTNLWMLCPLKDHSAHNASPLVGMSGHPLRI